MLEELQYLHVCALGNSIVKVY